jgi:hypothetical protein
MSCAARSRNLTFTAAEWNVFTDGAKAGEFDL